MKTNPILFDDTVPDDYLTIMLDTRIELSTWQNEAAQSLAYAVNQKIPNPIDTVMRYMNIITWAHFDDDKEWKKTLKAIKDYITS